MMYGATRPPVLGSMAVAGVVIAGLSAVASLLTAGYGAGLYLTSNAARERFVLAAPTSLPVASPSQPALLTTTLVTVVGPNGMEAGQRGVLIDAISQKIQMASEQAQQLDALLARDGARMFGPNEVESITPQFVLDAIGDHFGLLPAISSDAAEPFYFETPAGRAEVFSNRAMFYRKNALSPDRAGAGRRANVSGHPVLIPQDIDALVGLVQDAARKSSSKSAALNEAQVNTLRGLLANPKQELVSVVPGPEGPAVGIAGASIRPDGYAVVEFTGGPVLLNPAGRAVLQSDRDAFAVVSGAACFLVMMEGILSVALAVFLVIISLKLMNNPAQKLGTFKVYAFAKISLALLGAAAIGWMTDSFLTSSLKGSQSPSHAWPTAILAAVAFVTAGMLFPVVVLLVSRQHRVRDYYES
ncbi:MAG TPA: hypothetical protein VLJ39_15095 [Tepidisphaeraceae bacterium]|nr:hypothetical protein [Tepidisphaeraceae bacterium]